jgi:hypothetical protein
MVRRRFHRGCFGCNAPTLASATNGKFESKSLHGLDDHEAAQQARSAKGLIDPTPRRASLDRVSRESFLLSVANVRKYLALPRDPV